MARGGLGFLKRLPKGTVPALIGSVILVLLIALNPPLGMLRAAADDVADSLIRFSERSTARLPDTPAFVFIDIDDPTFADWGAPLVTPRDHLAGLIAAAARSAPLAIVVDVDLAFPDLPEREAALAAVIAGYPASAPPLMLVRSTISPAPGGPPLASLRSTPYDGAAANKPNIFFGTPRFLRDDDGRVRRWRLIEPVCVDGAPAALPSLHLVAALAARQALTPEDESLAGELDRALTPFVPDNCTDTAPRAGTLAAVPADRPIRIEAGDDEARILYRVAYEVGRPGLGPMVETATGEAPMVAIRPARLVLALPADQPVPGMDGRIALIGGSFRDSGDWYETPVGVMPGALIVANAIAALTSVGTPRSPALLPRLAIGLLLVIAAAAMLAHLRPMVAGLGIAALFFGLLVASIAWFRSGVLIDLAVPAVGIALIDRLDAIAESLAGIRRLGFGWLLKPPGPGDVPEIETATAPAAVVPDEAEPNGREGA